MLVSSGVSHGSIYLLEVDEDSRLGRELLDGGGRYHAGAAPADEMVADFYLEAVEVLGAFDLAQYEISNFARAGAAALHNRNYWLRQPYLGFGLDAHSMLRTPDRSAVRFQTGDNLATFLDGAGWENVQPVSQRQALEEAWFLGLRLNEGVCVDEMVGEFGEPEAHRYDDVIAELQALELVERRESRVRLTQRGRLMSNEVFERFLGDQAVAQADLVLVD